MASKKAGVAGEQATNSKKMNVVVANQEKRNRNSHKSEEEKPALDQTGQQKRVIRQIFTLDPKKLKDLGIESNILTAMTKLNGKTNDGKNAAIPSTVVDQRKSNNSNITITSVTVTQSSEADKEKLQKLNLIKPPALASVFPLNPSTKNKKIVTTSTIEQPNKTNTNIDTNKKVHVLSNVVLNDDKLVNLQQLSSAITGKGLLKPNVLIGKSNTASTIVSSVIIKNQNNLLVHGVQDLSTEKVQKNNDLYLHVKKILSKKPNETPNLITETQAVIQSVSKADPIASTTQKVPSNKSPVSFKHISKTSIAASATLTSSTVVDPFFGFSKITKKDQNSYIEKIQKLNAISHSKNKQKLNEPITLKSAIIHQITVPPVQTASLSPHDQCSDKSHTSSSTLHSNDTEKVIKLAQKTIDNDERYKTYKAKKQSTKQSLIDLLTEHVDKDNDDNDQSDEVSQSQGSISDYEVEYLVEEDSEYNQSEKSLENQFDEIVASEAPQLQPNVTDVLQSKLELSLNPAIPRMTYKNSKRRNVQSVEENAVEAILNMDKQNTSIPGVFFKQEIKSEEIVEDISGNNLDYSCSSIEVETASDVINSLNSSVITLKRKRGRPPKATKAGNKEEEEKEEEEEVKTNSEADVEQKSLRNTAANVELPKRMRKPRVSYDLETSVTDEDSPDTSNSTGRSKRKRKVNQFFEGFQTNITPQKSSEVGELPTEKEETPTQRKRRKKVDFEEEAADITTTSTAVHQTPNPPSKTTLPDEKLFKVPSKFFKCGNCKESILTTKWNQHTHFHYGLLWKDGIDDPFDLSNTQAQVVAINRYMKTKKVQYLKCKKCDERKRSALGYLSHIESCGLSGDEINNVKVECQFCKKLYRKSSIQIHEQSFCPVVKAAKKQEGEIDTETNKAEADVQTDAETVTLSQSGRPQRTKRRKTYREFDELIAIEDFVKAAGKITGGVIKGWSNQLERNKIVKCPSEGCSFISTTVAGIHAHHKECASKPFHCRICKFSGSEVQTMIDHVKAQHAKEWEAVQKIEDDSDKDYTSQGEQSSSSEESSGEEVEVDSDAEKQKTKRRHRSKLNLERYLEQNSPMYWDMIQDEYKSYLQNKNNSLPITIKWTKEFINEHYEKLSFTLNQQPEYVILPTEDGQYMADLEAKSIPFQFNIRKSCKTKVEVTDKWQELELFSNASTNGNELLLFCGGPIVAAEWVPFPNDYKGPQVIALCCRGINVPATNVRHGQELPTKYLIQFWSIDLTDKFISRLLYAVAFDDGPALSIKFCPSGCYRRNVQLALMAVPRFNGSVSIVSLPTRLDGDFDEVKIMKPSIKTNLQTCLNDEIQDTIVQLAWSHTMGHSILCAAYTTGMIALWNFQHLKSSYLCQDEMDHKVLLPFRMFYATSHCISHLDLRSDENDIIRWILVGGYDRKIHLFDLNDSVPMEVQTTVLKSRVVGGSWPFHWSLCLSVVDDAVTFLHAGMNVRSPIGINHTTPSTNYLVTGTSSNLAFSNWLNTAIFGNHIGHLFKKQFNQLLLYHPNDRYVEVIGCTHVVPLSDGLNEEASAVNATITRNEANKAEIVTQTNEEANGQESEIKDIDKNKIKIKKQKEAAEEIIVLDEHKGLVFSDFVTPVTLDVIKPTLAKERRSTDKEDLFAKINKIAINHSTMAYELYAVGYEKGFCRIKRLPK